MRADGEVFPIFSEIELALSKLPKWMQDEGRMWDATLFFKPMSTFSSRGGLMERTQSHEAAKGGFTGELPDLTT